MTDQKEERIMSDLDSPILIFKDTAMESSLESSEGPALARLSIVAFNPESLKDNNIHIETVSEKQIPSGTIEQHHINSKLFDELYNSSRNSNQNSAKTKNLTCTQAELFAELEKKDLNNPVPINFKTKRLTSNDPSSQTYMGPWAIYEGEKEFYREIIPSIKRAETAPNLPFYFKDRPQERFPGEMDPYYPPRPVHDVADLNFVPKSTFHLESETTYQNESYLAPTKDKTVPKNLSQCFIPNKCIFTYKGHTKPISVTRFFPRYGHMVVSASYDKTIRLWDVYTHRKLVRTYLGHTESVSDLSLTNDGAFFLSCGFDSRIQYWDTEAGKVIRTFNVQKLPYCIKFNPDEDRQSLFLTGSMNTKIEQYDIRSGSKVTTYTDHDGTVNCMVFVDNNKKFVSFGDDKKIVLWEFGVPVMIRTLNDAEITPIIRAELHPCKNYLVAQTTDNKLLVYDVKAGQLRINKKKKFVGHVNAGFCVRPIFSPNGFYVLSGDHSGKINVWDWKTEAKLQMFPAHNTTVTELDWHPNDSSMMVSGSWDNTVRLWVK